jgi:hypothetical protein
MIDGEGSVENSDVLQRMTDGRTYRNRKISIFNTDPGIMAACVECCEVLGIPYRLYETRGGYMHQLVIQKYEGFIKVRKLLPLQAAEKQRRVLAAIATFTRVSKNYRRQYVRSD